MKTIENLFGKFDGKEVQSCTLQNDHGVQVKISNYGVTITSIILPRKMGIQKKLYVVSIRLKAGVC